MDGPAPERAPEAELSWFVHAIAHELQNPLAGVAMLLTALTGTPAIDDRLRGQLAVASDAMRRTRHLVRGLVDYVDAGTAPLRKDQVASAPLVREVVTALELDGERIAIGTLPTVHVDRAALLRVLRELIDDAARRSRHEGGKVAVAARRHEDTWRFEIADDGAAIEPTHYARMFEPLFALPHDHEDGGAGLGRAIAARLVARHGGATGASARDHGGTVVWFTLPA